MLGSGELRELRSRIDTAVYTVGNREVTLRSEDGFAQALRLVDAIWMPARRREPGRTFRPYDHMRLLAFCLVALLAALVVLAAGCGGGGRTSVPSDAVAVVGSDTITKAQFNALLERREASYKARKQTFPKPGTTAVQDAAGPGDAYLVQQAELEQKAKDLGVTVTDKQIDDAARSRSRSSTSAATRRSTRQQLKAQGLTERSCASDVRAQLSPSSIYKKVTATSRSPTPTSTEYYDDAQVAVRAGREPRRAAHPRQQQGARRQLYAQLKAGARLRGAREEVLEGSRLGEARAAS